MNCTNKAGDRFESLDQFHDHLHPVNTQNQLIQEKKVFNLQNVFQVQHRNQQIGQISVSSLKMRIPYPQRYLLLVTVQRAL